jgi:purine nucleosidase
MNANPLPILLDTDIGDDIDDALALTVVLNSPELELVGVTTVFRDAPRRAILARQLLDMGGRGDVPAVAGCSEPLFPSWDKFPGGKSLGRQFEALDDSLQWTDTNRAVEFIIDKVRDFASRGERLTLVPIGALTNLALAFLWAPDIIPQCRVVLMGGKWGSKFAEPDAEWNILCDPEAAALVFRSGVDLTMVGLDVTMQCVLSPEEERTAW